LFEVATAPYEILQVLTPDAPAVAYPEGGNNPQVAPAPYGNPTDAQMGRDFLHGQPFVFPEILKLVG